MMVSQPEINLNDTKVYIYIYVYISKARNVEKVFHFHNEFILLMHACQMEFKWSLVTFSFFPLNAGGIFYVISHCDLFYLKMNG